MLIQTDYSKIDITAVSSPLSSLSSLNLPTLEVVGIEKMEMHRVVKECDEGVADSISEDERQSCARRVQESSR